MPAIDTINRVYREFKRYTGDGLPGEPTGAPLPVGDPQSGVHHPKKPEIRQAGTELLLEQEAMLGEATQLATPGDGTVTFPKLAGALVQTDAEARDDTADAVLPTVKRVVAIVNDMVPDIGPPVATRTALKALDTTLYTSAVLTEAGREGLFVWRTGDYSKQVGFDTAEGVFVKATAIAATAGAWVRVYSGGLDVKWFGAKGDYVANDTAAIQAAVDFHDQNLWKANFNSTTPSGLPTAAPYVLISQGIFGIDPAVGVRLWDKTEIRGLGTSSSFIKAFSSSAGHLIYRYYNGTATGNGRVEHIKISGIRGIVIGANQVIFDIQHVGRCEIFDVAGGTQDRVNEFNNANQRYHAGSALFKLGVGDSTPNGYVNGSDVMELHHFTATFLDYGVLGAAGANDKQPERLLIHHFEISDCHQAMVFNASAGMIGHIHDGVVQRWGNESIAAATGLAGADNYGIDMVANKYKLEDFYFEGNSTFAAILVRSGTANIIDAASMNRYGTTTLILSNSGTSTVIRTT